MNKKIAKNYIYNLIYQLVLALSPLIVLPYKTKVLMPDSIGIYSYVFSVLSYIIILGSLGIRLYGKREIAFVKENKYERSKVLYELAIIKLITFTLISLLFYLFIGFKSVYKIYYLIISVEIFFNIFDITWFYQGIEEFKKISIINIITRILNIISIFLFVKTDSDLIKYIIITVIFDVMPLIILLLLSKKYIEKIKLKELKIIKHIKPCIILFIPQICIQIYAVCDKIMLGNLQSNISEVGYYEYSHKIILIVGQIISSLAIVMSPIISEEYIKNNKEKIKKYMDESINISAFLAIPLTAGLIGVSSNLVNVIFGINYLKTHVLILILSIPIIPISITTIIGEQYLVSTKQEKKFTKYIITGTIINIIMNFILIPKYASIGASISTTITEIVILIIEIPIIKKVLNIKKFLKSFMKYLICSIVMLIIVDLIGKIGSNFFILIIQVLTGVIVYMILLIITNDKNIYNILKKLKKEGAV